MAGLVAIFGFALMFGMMQWVWALSVAVFLMIPVGLACTIALWLRK